MQLKTQWWQEDLTEFGTYILWTCILYPLLQLILDKSIIWIKFNVRLVSSGNIYEYIIQLKAQWWQENLTEFGTFILWTCVLYSLLQLILDKNTIWIKFN